MIERRKVAPTSRADRMRIRGVWRTDLENPAEADVLIVATGASREEGFPCRANIDRFEGLLRERGAGVAVLDADELDPKTAWHPDAPEALRQLIRRTPPRAMVVFGKKAVRNVGQALSADLPVPPLPGAGIVERDLNGCRLIPMLSLSPPVWSLWKRWAWPYLGRVADHIGDHLELEQRASLGNACNNRQFERPYVIAENGRRR